MSDGRWETQQAVYDALVAAGIAGGRIFAPVKEGYDPPNATDLYVSIEDGDTAPDDYVGMAGLNERLELHLWQRASSFKAIKQEISAIRDVLHDKVLTVAGQDFAYSQLRSDRVERDPDGLTLHAIIEIIIIHQKDT